MITLNKNKTKEKLRKWGIICDDHCPVCNDAVENNEHLFFNCKFSERCLMWWCEKLRIKCDRKSTNGICDWVKRRTNLTSLQRKVVYASLSAMVYVIWKNRNSVVWESKCAQHVMKTVMLEVREKLLHIVPKNISLVAREWLNAVGFI